SRCPNASAIHPLTALAHGMRGDEVQEDPGRRCERPAPVVDEIEIPLEAETLDGAGPQLLGPEFSLDGQPREERDPEAAFHRVLDGRIAAELERHVQAGQRRTGPLEAPLQDTAGAGTRLADDERLAGQGVERDAPTTRPRMPRGDD